MDRSATTAAYVSGMQESLSLYGNELVEFTTFLSIGYAIFIVPSQLIQTQIRPSLWLPICEIIWGAFTLATFAATNAKTIFILRFFLGVFEATSWPGIVNLIFNCRSYKNLNGAGGLEGWQWLFVVSGIMTMAWGAYGLLIVPDTPVTTRALWLPPFERALAVARMNDAGTTTQEFIKGKALWKRVRNLFTSPISYLFLAAYLQFAWSQRANSYFLLYLKGLTDSVGEPLYSAYKVNLIPLGGYAISIVANIGLNALSDWKGWCREVSIGAALLQLLATSVLSAWPDDRHTIMAFYFLTFATAAWGYALLAWLAIVLRKEPEARSVIVGVAVTVVYVGHATIPLRAWRVSDALEYPVGFPLAAAFCVGSIVAMLGLIWSVRQHPVVLELGLDWKSRTVSEVSVDTLDDVEASASGAGKVG